MQSEKTSFKFTFERFLSCLAFAWLFINSVLIVCIPDSTTHLFKADNTRLIGAVILTGVISLTLFIVDARLYSKNIAPGCFVSALYVFSLILCVRLEEMSTYIIVFVLLLLSFYCFEKKYKPMLIHKKISSKTVLATVMAVTAFAAVCVCIISVLRYITYSAPNYDFGIFCNMFYNMKKSGLPISSCERDRVLSHFAVHISPAFYLLLPVYFVFSSPVTLAVLQPVIIFSGLIPLYLLAKHMRLSQNAAMFILAAFSLYAALSTGCFYDIHENCFLVPFLIWMFYFFEKDRKIPLFVCMVLVLLVKEDAFIYIVFFALYVIISRKKFVTGGALLALSVAYLLLASHLLNKYGLGIMSSRYNNLSESGSLIDAVKTLFINPGYAISQLLETKDSDFGKIYYIASLFCPLLFIPFISRDFTRLTLLLPIFINLLTKYPYQYNIIYQYTFGICAFLFYLTLLNLSDMPKQKQRTLSFGSLLMALILFSSIVLPKCESYIIKYNENKETYRQISQALEVIPDNAEVTSSTYILPHLTSRDIIYEDEYHKEPSTEYFVLDLRQAAANGRAEVYINAGYELIGGVPEVLEIYRLAQ